MKQPLRRPRILILALLCVSFIAPILFLSVIPVDLSPSIANRELFGEISGIVKSLSPKHPNDALKLNSIKQEFGEGLKEPAHVAFKDRRYRNLDTNGNNSNVNTTTSGVANGHVAGGSETSGGELQQHTASDFADGKGLSNRQTVGGLDEQPGPRPVTNAKIGEMQDQLTMAKAYLLFAPPNSNSHLVRELKLRIKEIDRVLGHASKDSDLSRIALQRMRAMEFSLSKANKAYPDCSAMVSKLRAMTYNTEEQLRAQKNQASYLVQLSARNVPKGFHCLSMRLTVEYFNLQPEAREFPNRQKVHKFDLYHYAIFSDNVLACAVVVNSTISTSMEPERIVFHVVTDSVNYPAMMMWFLVNPPGNATIQIENLDDFKWLPSGYSSMFQQQGVRDPRYTSALNHLRFYLPEIFPLLNKVLLLDHDVVVQRDLGGLWRLDMKGKVNGAVEICRAGDPSHRLEMLVDFSDPTIAKHFNADACIWAFGMNMFDLLMWRRRGLTGVYNKWLQLGKKRPIWKAGSLPLGQLTFYNHTVALDRRWHGLGLGHDPDIGRSEVERAAVIHYDGHSKPWLESSIPKYRGYWNKFVSYDHPYLQQCNIHP